MGWLRSRIGDDGSDPWGWMAACDYRRAPSLLALDEDVGPAIEAGEPVAVDLETTSLNPWDPAIRVVGVNISWAEGRARYVPVGHRVGYAQNLPWPDVLARLQRWDGAGVTTLWYHSAYDHEVLRTVAGWEPTHFDEVRWGAVLADANQRATGLKAVAARLLGLTMPTLASVVGPSVSVAEVEPEAVVAYGCADADLTRRIWRHPVVVEAVRRQRAVYEVEKRLLGPFRRCLRQGVFWDVARLAVIEAECRAGVAAIEAAVRALPGGSEVNLDAPAQVGVWLQRMGVRMTVRTATGQVATGKEVLVACRGQISVEPVGVGRGVLTDVVDLVLIRRELMALWRTVVRKVQAASQVEGPRLRVPFNQIGAPTGRMSCGGDAEGRGVVGVNMQALPDPVDSPYVPDIRSAVVAEDPSTADPADPWEIWALDYSQVELRMAANLSGEPVWIQAFQRGEDIHHLNAQLAYGTAFPRYDAEGREDPRRKRGKTMGFAVLYGAGPETVAEHGGISLTQARALLTAFFAAVPRLSAWIGQTQARARVEGVVRTWLGRERSLRAWYGPDGSRAVRQKGDREAVNTLIQGGAADLFKVAICRVDQLLQVRGWTDVCQMILFLHDEIVFRGRRRLRDVIVPALIETMMTIPIPGHRAPYVVEAWVGPDWGAGLQRYTIPTRSSSCVSAPLSEPSEPSVRSSPVLSRREGPLSPLAPPPRYSFVGGVHSSC